jgi:gamma-glutamyltranspeptidase/glutathione hydrolase
LKAVSTPRWWRNCRPPATDVEVLPEAFSDTMGHAGALVRHASGVIEGAADPRIDGVVAGL